MLPASGIMVFETGNRPQAGSTQKMLPDDHPDRIHVAFDDHRLAEYHRGHTRGGLDALPYWMDGAADVAETSYTPFHSEPDAAPVRLIVRRVQPTPGCQPALFASYSYHGCITDREGNTLELEADHRRHAEIENAIRDLKYGVGLNHLPSARFPANPEPAEGGLAGRPGHRPQPGPLDRAHRPGRADRDHHQDPAAAFLRPGRTAHPQGTAPHPTFPHSWPWENQFGRALARLRALPLPA